MASHKISLGKSMLAVLFAGLAAATVNAVLFFIFKAAGVITNLEVMPGQPMTVMPPVMMSILPALVAGLVFWALDRFTSSGFKIFTILAGVLLVLSFANPFMGIKGITVGYGLVLNLMHVVVAGSIWLFIRREVKK